MERVIVGDMCDYLRNDGLISKQQHVGSCQGDQQPQIYWRHLMIGHWLLTIRHQ